MSYKLTAVSTRCATDARGKLIEDPIKGEFATVDDVKRFLRGDFRDLTVYWQVFAYNDDNSRAFRAYRTGRGCTGKRWIYELA